MQIKIILIFLQILIKVILNKIDLDSLKNRFKSTNESTNFHNILNSNDENIMISENALECNLIKPINNIKKGLGFIAKNFKLKIKIYIF